MRLECDECLEDFWILYVTSNRQLSTVGEAASARKSTSAQRCRQLLWVTRAAASSPALRLAQTRT